MLRTLRASLRSAKQSRTDPGKKGQKCHYKDSNSNSDEGVGLGSTRKIVKLGETVENMIYTPPSPMKATPTTIASNSNDVSTVSVSKADDFMMMSSSQAP